MSLCLEIHDASRIVDVVLILFHLVSDKDQKKNGQVWVMF